MICRREPCAAEQVKSFRYPVISTGATESPSSGPGQPDVSYMAREQKLQQAQAAAVEAAREQGIRDGEARAQASIAARVEQERRAIAEAIAAFRGEAGAYFRRVETELVRLAVAIARKVLHREAQLDPLLLAGVVRVALDQIQDGSQVVLRARRPPRQTRGAPCWRRSSESQPDGRGHPGCEARRNPLSAGSGFW